MGGRGRGGKTCSLTQEQLQTLGCFGKDAPQVLTAPPPTYPSMLVKPVFLEMTADQNYQILWKEDFLNHMHDSPYFMTQDLEPQVTSPQYFSDRFVNAMENSKIKSKSDFPWKRMPSELQMQSKKRRRMVKACKTATKRAKVVNIEVHLKLLEEKERAENEKTTTPKNGSDSENEKGEEEEEIPVDEEMDDENDYGHSYFDNGEAYNEDDEHFDDGPVY